MENEKEIVLVGHAANGEEAIEFLNENFVGLILLEILMPGVDGEGVMNYIYHHKMGQKALILSSYYHHTSVITMLNLGAKGYILKTSLMKELVPSINTVFQGTNVFSEEVTNKLLLKNIVNKMETKSRTKALVLAAKIGLI